MKKIAINSVSLSVACILAFTALPRVMSENVVAGDAKALLDEAKKNQADRKRAAMQKELDRLSEDAKKAKQEISDLEKSFGRKSQTTSSCSSSSVISHARLKRAVPVELIRSFADMPGNAMSGTG